jgi:hypothetical protein
VSFGDSVECCVALDLDMGHNFITDADEGLVRLFIHAYTVVGATFFSDKGNVVGRKLGLRWCEAEESMNGRDRSINEGGCSGSGG